MLLCFCFFVCGFLLIWLFCGLWLLLLCLVGVLIVVWVVFIVLLRVYDYCSVMLFTCLIVYYLYCGFFSCWYLFNWIIVLFGLLDMDCVCIYLIVWGLFVLFVTVLVIWPVLFACFVVDFALSGWMILLFLYWLLFVFLILMLMILFC